jgi:hypothetical protein
MKKHIEDWVNYVQESCDLLSKTAHNTRVVLKYRNKPARGKLNITNNSKVRKFFNFFNSKF